MKEAIKRGLKFNITITDYNNKYSVHRYNETPLHIAATYNKKTESIKFLIEQGIDINAFASDGGSSGSGGTPLSDAIAAKNISAITELLRAGANPNANSGSFGVLEHLSSIARSDKVFAQNVLNMLINKGINLNTYQETQPSDIRYPDEENTMSMVEIRNLVASRTSLISAVIDDNPNFVDILLDAGVRVDLRDMFNKTAIDYAYELPTNSKIKKSHVYSRLISIKLRH